MQRPTWKYNNETPWWTVAAAGAIGYELENLDGPTAFMTLVQNQPKVHKESNLVSSVTYLGETLDNSDPNSTTKTRSVKIDITCPKSLHEPLTWMYISGTPTWSVWGASQMGYTLEKID